MFETLLARSSIISRTRFLAAFRLYFKEKPLEYLTKYRLFVAAIALTSIDKSLFDFSISRSFNSTKYFAKVFFGSIMEYPKNREILQKK